VFSSTSFFQVLRECFRPILPSFQSRLETIFSATPSLATKGSFESICSVYESTLRFLSIAYELVAGAFLDLAESGLVKGDKAGVELYNDMVSVFLQVASPFANYQQRFEELEGKHLQVATSLVSKDMRQVAGSVSSQSAALETLQDATERLKDLAPFIFPMTEGSLDRFELLNGGYRVGPALGAVDKILAEHVGELVIAIRSLSAAMTADVNQLADVFDEQHVLCAMEVLKLAGKFRRDLQGFEGKTRDRLTVLTERMLAHRGQELELKKPLRARVARRSPPFPYPIPCPWWKSIPS
jgi:hypothetical protein